jgi:hypothetical protein
VHFTVGMFVRRIASLTLALLRMSAIAVLQKQTASVETVEHVVNPEQLSPASAQGVMAMERCGFGAVIARQFCPAKGPE